MERWGGLVSPKIPAFVGGFPEMQLTAFTKADAAMKAIEGAGKHIEICL
jgi:hypothetical protein